jgi:hypothetical protein
MARVGQNRMYTPYMIVYLMISLPKYLGLARNIYIRRRELTKHSIIYGVKLYGSGQPQKHHINTVYIWFWPTLFMAGRI